MHKEEKVFETAFRILEILKLLLNENLSKADLIKKLSIEKKANNVYSFEAFIKYFNTLEFMGLKIDKDKNLYILQNSINGLDLTSEEKELFWEIINNIHVLYNDTKEKIVKNIFCKLTKYINNEEINEFSLQETYKKREEERSLAANNNIISTFKSVIQYNHPIKLCFLSKNKKVRCLIVKVKEIKEKNNNTFIKCFVPAFGRNKNINLDLILSVDIIPSMKSPSCLKEAVIFELYGRLASLYKVKPSEKVVTFRRDYRIVSNLEEEKDILLKRLLKYGENCKIISPASVKEEFLSMVDNILSKLESAE